MSVRIALETPAALEPGDEVAGTATGDGELVVSLLWFTSGQGSEDVHVVAQTRGRGAVPFRFVVPDAPWSFAGRLIHLRWAVEASLEPGGDVAREGLVCAPGRAEVRIAS